MKSSGINDPVFKKAVEAIDAGNIIVLEKLIIEHPHIVKERLATAEEGYFKDPYLLWFIAENPIRTGKLPTNVTTIARLLIDAVKQQAKDTAQLQLDYALGLVATGRIPRECGVQIEMMDLLIDAGATPGEGLGALAHGNIEAAEHLTRRSGKISLPVAVGLKRMDDIARLLPGASDNERITALTMAGFYGMPDMISYLLKNGISPNGYPREGGFHQHATPLHQAVCSGSLEAVKLLVEAGANITATDKIYEGTPLGWAMHMRADNSFDEDMKVKFSLIEDYLRKIQLEA